MTDPRRGIPAMEGLLGSEPFAALVTGAGRGRVAAVLRGIQREVRQRIAEGDPGEVPPSDAGWYAAEVAARLERADRPRPGAVINATGVVLHTNLGRAPLAEAAIRAMVGAAGYATLEYDPESGGRGSRQDHCAGVLRELTGAEASLVVNNNAAAVVLALNTLAPGREAIISRGELVEIGGSFRVPEIMARSGVVMREVGSTNRTHARDYEAAAGPETGLILKVHRSNFRIDGFTTDVELPELAGIAAGAGVPLVNDLGSGLLHDLSALGLPREPTAAEALAAGADVVTMSGDKLLGGPQAGIVLGRASLVERMRANPLARALRPDKVTLAALHATLALHLDPTRALEEVPVLRMLAATTESLRARATDLARRLRDRGVDAGTAPGTSAVGGGAYPGTELDTVLVTVATPYDPDRVAAALRGGEPPVVARIRDGRLLLDPRTVAPEQEAGLLDAIVAVIGRKE